MSYDRYGNRSVPQNGQTPNPATNHDGLHSYDAAGNVTDNGAYTYDAEGNLFSSSDGMQRFYDALNRLVYQYNNNVGYGRLYAYGLDNKRRGVFDGGATKLSAVIYASGQPIAYWDRFSNSYNYQYQNQVGTDSARENNGSISTFSSLPFGDGVQSSGQDTDIYHYAGLDVGNASTTQWDQSTLEHAQFREYSPSNGHWFSPDPSTISYNFRNPQTFNRYSYALNKPLSLSDPSGLDPDEDADPCDELGVICAYGPNDYDSTGGGSGGGGCASATCESVTVDGGPPDTVVYTSPDQINTYLAYSPITVLASVAPNNGENPSPCLAANIAAVNQVSNLNVNASNVVGQPFIYNGGLDVNFSVPGGSPSQLPVGRYPSSILGRIFGFGNAYGSARFMVRFSGHR